MQAKNGVHARTHADAHIHTNLLGKERYKSMKKWQQTNTDTCADTDACITRAICERDVLLKGVDKE